MRACAGDVRFIERGEKQKRVTGRLGDLDDVHCMALAWRMMST